MNKHQIPINHKNYLFANAIQKILFATVILVLSFPNAYSQTSVNYWSAGANAISANKLEKDINPLASRTVTLKPEILKSALSSVKAENLTSGYHKNDATITIPLPDGSDKNFYIEESSIMAPELAEKYPQIKTYIITAADGTAYTGRVDFTQFGFHAIIFTPEGTVYVDPYSRQDDKTYLSYYKKDFVKTKLPSYNGNCVKDNPEARQKMGKLLAAKKSTLITLRNYRLALAATGEYTAYYGGTVAGALSGMVTTLNRVNAIYEKELAIRMTLIANDDIFIYTNSDTDPYSNDDGGKMLDQNQATMDSAIGINSYDIGHVFSTGGGGVAYVGAICTSYKAGGVTGGPAPIGDPFDVDYVAHEMGHQFGADHTFNSESADCGGNREITTAYEPGSGSTIMAYAGICAPDNLQRNSDDYFHAVSIEEINYYTSMDVGNSCAEISTVNNYSPVVISVGASGLYIPINTPFALTGSATDQDGDLLTYCWEEYDLGPSGSPDSASGSAPIFRSFKPTASSVRVFPKLSDILNNSHTMGEILPSYTRSLSFRLTVRDNKALGGGTDYGDIKFNVTSAAGPFKITSPNTSGSWKTNSRQVITWNVAGTNVSPVSCSSVNILLSTDGGLTFPITLASKTPNDGSEEIITPDNVTTTARIKIEAADNIFFDISDTNFTIKLDDTPVELTSFGIADTKNGVHIKWSTATEVNNSGFYIERSSDKKNFSTVTFIAGKGSTTEKSNYEYTDRAVSEGAFSYRLKQVDNDGTYTYSNTVDVLLTVVKSFTLEQNHPNPYNPSTTIVYSLKENQHAVLKVFDVLGNEIATLVNENKPAGRYQVEFNKPGLPSGLYFYQLTAGGSSITKKMMMLK